MSSPIASCNTYTILASPDEPSPLSNMEISPSPPYIPSTPTSTPSPKPRKSLKATMMKTGGCRPKPQLARCSSGSPKRGLAKKVTTQAATVANSKTDKKLAVQHAAMISQACRIFRIPLSTTLKKFSKENPLVGHNGNEVHVVNAATPILPIPPFNPQPIPKPVCHDLHTTAKQLIQQISHIGRGMSPITEINDPTVIMAVDDLVNDLIERGCTPTRTRPLVGIHPGPGWIPNTNHHNITTFNGTTRVPVPFIQYDFLSLFPKILLTRGHGCTVETRDLQAHQDLYPRGILRTKEEYLFFEDEPFTMLINKALDLEKDVTLKAEVWRYQSACHTLKKQAVHLGQLRHKFEDAQWELRDSLKALLHANAFKRLKPCIQYEVAIDNNIPPQDCLDGIDKINDPWAEGLCEVNVKCLWCRCLGHATHHCQMLHQCVLCWGKGHLEEQCRWPHAKCVEGKICRVNPDHVNWHKMLCKATVKVCNT
jgi:hypothetical protein